MFPSGSGSNSPNPFTSPPGSFPSTSLTSPYTGSNPNGNNAATPPKVRSPSVSSYSAGQPYSSPLSPPPSSPLPPLPSASLPSPAFRVTPLPTPGALPAMTTTATPAASGRTSPLAALSPSLPSSTSGTSHADDRHGRRDGDGIGGGRGDGPWGEVEDGDTMRLSTLDAFRRQLDESADEIRRESHSEDDGEHVLRLGEKKDKRGASTSEDEKGDGREEGEDAHSDGEVGIGLSLMGALGGEDDELEGRKADAEPVKKTRGGSVSKSGAGSVGVGANGNASGVSSENGGTTAMVWTRYTPTSPVSDQDLNGQRRTGEEEGGGGDEEEDEDDGGYWDDIYDDYRYSRHSLASRRYSAASKRASIMSKASGASKASSKARANAPPMPVPPDRPSFDASRPSIGSDGTGGRSRPSFESASSSMSASMPFTRPSLTRSASDESTHQTHVLPLTAQFPAVPEHVPVRTESRLRVVHDGYMEGGDDHGERELQVVHGSTEGDAAEVGLNIEVVEVAEEDDTQSQEVDLGRLTSLNPNMALSPLLHTRFGSPHSSRFTDFEDGSDQDGRRYSNKSGKSMMSSVEGSGKSPIDGGGMASALRARMEAEHTPSSDPAPSLVVPASTADSSSSGELGVRAIVVDDEEGRVTDINITVDDPILATEATPPLPTPSLQTLNVSQVTVATDPTGPLSANQPDDAEKSPFLRQRPQPSQSPHPFARTSMFLPHPNAPKAVHQSQGPMYGRTAPQPYAYPVPSGPGAGNAMHPLTPPGTTFYSTQILHQLRSVSIQIAASQGPARRPPMTLFARCEPDLSASMAPVPILFSLDPLPPLPTAPARPQTKVGSGKGTPYAANMTPTRAATVSAPVRRGGGDGMPPNEGGPGAGDPSSLRLPKRSATAVASVSGPQGIDVGPSSSLPIPREGFVPQVGAARPRSRSFSEFGARVPSATPQERRLVQSSGTWFMNAHGKSVVQSGRACHEGAWCSQCRCAFTQCVSPTCVGGTTRSISPCPPHQQQGP